MNIVIEFLKYRVKAKRRHGVHSPYVYSLQDKSFKKPLDNNFLSSFKNLQGQLFKNKKRIAITPFGAGSKSIKSNTRRISDIAKTSSTTLEYGKLIYRLGEHIEAKKALELGTNLGLGTTFLTQVSTLNKLTTVEGCSSLIEEAKKNLSKINTTCNIEFFNSSFKNHLENTTEIFDLVYIDGDHRSDALFEILNLLENKIHNESLIIIDDIRWSDDMFQAWTKIKLSKNFHLSMDFFRMGVIAKRTTQVKEHFILKK